MMYQFLTYHRGSLTTAINSINIVDNFLLNYYNGVGERGAI